MNELSSHFVENDDLIYSLHLLSKQNKDFDGKFLRNTKELASYLKGISTLDNAKKQLIIGDGSVHVLFMNIELSEGFLKAFIIDSLPNHKSMLTDSVQKRVQEIFENCIVYRNEQKLQFDDDSCRVFSLVNSELSVNFELYKGLSNLNKTQKNNVVLVNGSDLPPCLIKNIQSISNFNKIKKEISSVWENEAFNSASLEKHVNSSTKMVWDKKREKNIPQNRSLDSEYQKIISNLKENSLEIDLNLEDICFKNMGIDILEILENDYSVPENIKIEPGLYKDYIKVRVPEIMLPSFPPRFKKLLTNSNAISYSYDLLREEYLLEGRKESLIKSITGIINLTKNEPSKLINESHLISNCHILILVKHLIENFSLENSESEESIDLC